MAFVDLGQNEKAQQHLRSGLNMLGIDVSCSTLSERRHACVWFVCSWFLKFRWAVCCGLFCFVLFQLPDSTRSASKVKLPKDLDYAAKVSLSKYCLCRHRRHLCSWMLSFFNISHSLTFQLLSIIQLDSVLALVTLARLLAYECQVHWKKLHKMSIYCRMFFLY